MFNKNILYDINMVNTVCMIRYIIFNIYHEDKQTWEKTAIALINHKGGVGKTAKK
jgi:hypothetical protein